MTLPTLWTQHIKDPKAKQKFEEALYNQVHTHVNDRLCEIIKQRMESAEWKADFDNPNWPYKQAFILGQRQALKSILELIDISEA